MAEPGIFVDTSAWLAVSDRRDRFHAPARSYYQQLLAGRLALVTTNLVIAETYILIRRAAGHTPAMAFLRSLRGSPRLQRVWSGDELDAKAESILAAFADQDFSLTDAVSFAVMQTQGIRQAFTFDHHFAAAGFEMLPGNER